MFSFPPLNSLPRPSPGRRQGRLRHRQHAAASGQSVRVRRGVRRHRPGGGANMRLPIALCAYEMDETDETDVTM